MTPPTPESSDHEYCRQVLGRVSRTFALNIRLLRGPFGEAVRAGYLLCRAADALEDSWPGAPDEIRGRFEVFLRALDGDRAAAAAISAQAAGMAAGREDLELVAQLPRVLRVADALPDTHRPPLRECVATLASGMSRYASRAASRPPGAPYLDTDAELDDYCWIVAGCVGVMLTKLFAAEYGMPDAALHERRLALAPHVGRALQLTNIALDWPSDVRRGRCYVPAAWLAERGLAPADLVGAPRPEVRELAARLVARARESLARVPEYVEAIPRRRVRYRLFCLWPALWALGSLRAAESDPEFPWGERRPRLSKTELFTSAVGAALTVHHADALRWQYALAERRPAPAG